MSTLIKGFEPFFTPDSRVLILGSFPSVKSRQTSFYYGNVRNSFWKIIANFFGEQVPVSTEEKKDLLLRRRLALWDIVTECEIVASRDDTIKNYKVADLPQVLQNSEIKYILINGGMAYKIFQKNYKLTGVSVIALPSTSPANTRRKDDEWYAALRRAFSGT